MADTSLASISWLSTSTIELLSQENGTSTLTENLGGGSWNSGEPKSGFSTDDVVAVLYWIIFCLSVPSNITVLVVIVWNKTSEKHRVTKFLISSLALADLCLALFVTWTEAVTSGAPKWSLGSVWCTLYTFARSTLSHCSTYTLAVIGFER